MPPSFVLAAVTLCRPDGAPLVSNITTTFGPGLTALVGPNGTGKTSLLRLLAGELAPAAGQLRRPRRIGFLHQTEAPGDCPLRGLFPPDLSDASIRGCLAQAGLEVDPGRAVFHLSGGQQTRARLAALMSVEPEALLLDEPTNHLDAEARSQVIAQLVRFRGTAVVASHDPDLLRHCPRIAELSAQGLALHGDGYDAFLQARTARMAQAARAMDLAERGRAEAARAAQAAAERKARRDGQGRRERASGSQGKMLMDFRKERAEATARGQSQLAGRRAEAADAAYAAARAGQDLRPPLSALMPRLNLPATRVLLRARGLRLERAADGFALGPMDLDIVGPERIALTGPNGSGKSTLLRLLSGELGATAGHVDRMARIARLDQQALPAGADLVEAFRTAHPALSLQDAHAALARFGFRGAAARRRPDRLSGGEALRAALAILFGGPSPPEMLLLDEPSNHLDADARAMLTEALVACDAAVVIASHDRDFLAAVGTVREIAL